MQVNDRLQRHTTKLGKANHGPRLAGVIVCLHSQTSILFP